MRVFSTVSKLRSVGSRAGWLISLLLPLAILAISIVQRPSLFEATIVAEEVAAAQTAPRLIYETPDRQVYFTTDDLLHPEAFGVSEAQIGAVAIDLVPTDERDDSQARLSTWLLQIGRLLNFQTDDGTPLPDVAPTDQDVRLQEEFAAFMTDPPEMRRGAAVLLPLSEMTTVRAQSGLAAFLFIAVARAPGAPPPQGDAGLATALARGLDRFAVLDLAVPALGIPCIGGLAGRGGCEQSDWRIILDVVDQLPAGGPSVVVLGGWAKTDTASIAKARHFNSAWRDWQRTVLAPRSETPSHEAPRLAAIALLGSLLAAAARATPFSFARLLALVVLSGALLGIAVQMASSYLSLWSSPFGTGADFWIKLAAAVLLGVFVDVVVRFDPKKLVQPKTEEEH